jgi:hypothetical protein
VVRRFGGLAVRRFVHSSGFGFGFGFAFGFGFVEL